MLGALGFICYGAGLLLMIAIVIGFWYSGSNHN